MIQQVLDGDGTTQALPDDDCVNRPQRGQDSFDGLGTTAECRGTQPGGRAGTGTVKGNHLTVGEKFLEVRVEGPAGGGSTGQKQNGRSISHNSDRDPP
jgi:hypothetical protein